MFLNFLLLCFMNERSWIFIFIATFVMVVSRDFSGVYVVLASVIFSTLRTLCHGIFPLLYWYIVHSHAFWYSCNIQKEKEKNLCRSLSVFHRLLISDNNFLRFHSWIFVLCTKLTILCKSWYSKWPIQWKQLFLIQTNFDGHFECRSVHLRCQYHRPVVCQLNLLDH